MSGKSERRCLIVFGSLSDAGPVRLSSGYSKLCLIAGEKGIIATEHAVDAMDLTLWKVGTRMTMVSDSTTNSPAGWSRTPLPIGKRKHLTGKNVPGSVLVKLEGELDSISGHLPATTLLNPQRDGPEGSFTMMCRQHLHIIVELPSGKRSVHWVSEISLTMSRSSSSSFLTLLRLSSLPCRQCRLSLRPVMRSCFRSRCIPIAVRNTFCGNT
jgi:hypothetical protein